MEAVFSCFSPGTSHKQHDDDLIVSWAGIRKGGEFYWREVTTEKNGNNRKR